MHAFNSKHVQCSVVINYNHTFIIHVGVLLGDPHGENKFISHPTVRQRDIRAVEAVCGDGKKFVLSALDIFFTKSTLARSLVTKKEGRDQLDPDIIEGLRRKLMKLLLVLCL